MRLMVTGAGGFVGRALAARLSARHDLVLILRPGSPAPALGRAVRTVAWDLEGAPPAGLPDHIDGVVHLAQCRRYRAFPDSAGEMLNVNVAAAVHLADYARRAGARHFCLASSGSVYEPFDMPLTEGGALAPTTFNGASKLAAEQLLAPFRAYMPVFVPRLFFPYGPGQVDRLIPDLIGRVRAGRPIQLDADGGGLALSPIFVTDVVDILEKAVENLWDGTVNVAGPEAVSLRGLGETIGELLGRPALFEAVDRPPQRILPDLARLRALHPVASMVGVREGLRRTLAADGAPD
ncbi:MAG TPA: NAD(P)-dependent oxidoreductase [Azospirillaceae bacterium]|nr:NAD(P)-dependent oxidoreductase [Azospirillaceae bacterium]